MSDFLNHQLKFPHQTPFAPMIGENRQLVTDEPVKFEKQPVEVQDCRKITDHFRGIYRIYPNLMKENRRVWTCNRLDLQIKHSDLKRWLCPKIFPITGLHALDIHSGCWGACEAFKSTNSKWWSVRLTSGSVKSFSDTNLKG